LSRVSGQAAHKRAQKGAAGRHSPDFHIRSLATADLTDQQKRRVIRLALSWFSGGDDDPAARGGGVPHGTISKYNYGCRCDACTAANRQHGREQRARARAARGAA
jgi:hypothetical protein